MIYLRRRAPCATARDGAFACMCANEGSSVLLCVYAWVRRVRVCVCAQAYMLCEACCWPSKQTGVRSYQCLAPVARWKPGGEKGESPGPHWGNKTARLSLLSPKRTHTLMGTHSQTHTCTQIVAEMENRKRRNRRDRKRSYKRVMGKEFRLREAS